MQYEKQIGKLSFLEEKIKNNAPKFWEKRPMKSLWILHRNKTVSQKDQQNVWSSSENIIFGYSIYHGSWNLIKDVLLFVLEFLVDIETVLIPHLRS